MEEINFICPAFAHVPWHERPQRMLCNKVMVTAYLSEYLMTN